MATDPQIENPLWNQEPGDLLDDVEKFHKQKFHQNQSLGEVIDLITLQKGALIARDPRDPLLSAQESSVSNDPALAAQDTNDSNGPALGAQVTNDSNDSTLGAQDSNDHATPFRLTPAEKSALDYERHSSWFFQTRELRVTILVTACAAITQGWQQSTINASSSGLCEHFSLKPNRIFPFGFINAAPWLSGSIIGTWLSDPLQERYFGRRPVLGIAAIFCIVCVIGTAESNKPWQLWFCRLLLGIGVKIGTKASVAPVFAAEAAPDKHRGRVLMMWQLFDALGIFLGFVCALLVRDSWRVLLASAIIPPTALLFLVLVCPESPRFYIRRKRYVDAYKSLRHLRGTDIQAARDLYYIHRQLQAETDLFVPVETNQEAGYEALIFQNWIKRTGPFERMWYLFSKPRSRRACVVAFIVMAVQQLCGINVLAFYSFLLFNPEQTTTDWRINWFNFGFGLANVTFTFLAYPFIDSKGRRPLMLISVGGMTVSLFIISGLFWIPNEETRAILVAVFTIAVFTFFYSIGAGPIPFTLSAEVFPLCLREVGMSFSVMVNFLGLGFLVLFVPKLTSALDDGKPDTGHAPSYILIFFSVLNVVAFILVFLLVPETNHQSLEGMKTIFVGETTKERALRHIHSVRSSSHPDERDGVPMQRVQRPDEEG